MVKHVKPDQVLVKMPSLRAVKSFVAAAKYQNFTRAAESLCVTQAAISRQIRELEAYLGVELFNRSGRTVELTEAGNMFFDAAYLSFVNISQAAERIQAKSDSKRLLTICCTPAFSTLWLSRRLPSFFSENLDVELNIVTTESFHQIEPGIYPDVFINKVISPWRGYHSLPLFHDLIYPVCTPSYLEKNPGMNSIDSLRHAVLLNLSPYGRSQVAEHLDWDVWFSFFGSADGGVYSANSHVFNANDYNMLIQMVLNDQGVSLGWNHLVAPLVAEGKLIRPVQEFVELKEKCHYLTYAESKGDDEVLLRFRQWILDEMKAEKTSFSG